ncbi:hypothetical protein CR513_52930, partial [Mucuna pruriens]
MSENFDKINFHYVTRDENQMVDALATLSAMLQASEGQEMTIHEAKGIMEEIHEGTFGTHTNGHALARKILRIYADNINVAPSALHNLTSPWPFSMWGLDIIGPIEPKASNRHKFILVAID